MKNHIENLKKHYTQNSDTIKSLAKTSAALAAVPVAAGVYVIVKQNQTMKSFIKVNDLTDSFTAFITE